MYIKLSTGNHEEEGANIKVHCIFLILDDKVLSTYEEETEEKLLILYSNVSLIAHSAKVLGSRRGTEHILLLQYRYTPLRICTFIWKIHF